MRCVTLIDAVLSVILFLHAVELDVSDAASVVEDDSLGGAEGQKVASLVLGNVDLLRDSLVFFLQDKRKKRVRSEINKEERMKKRRSKPSCGGRHDGKRQ